jgi:hypothetical protein
MARRFAIAALLLLVGLGAFGGGIYGIAGADGIPIAWLEGTPFRTYLVPSLILFVAVGGSSLVAAIAMLARAHRARLLTFAAVLVGLGWLAAETAIIGFVSWLQPATAAVLAIVLALAASSPRGGVRATTRS